MIKENSNKIRMACIAMMNVHGMCLATVDNITTGFVYLTIGHIGALEFKLTSSEYRFELERAIVFVAVLIEKCGLHGNALIEARKCLSILMELQKESKEEIFQNTKS